MKWKSKAVFCIRSVLKQDDCDVKREVNLGGNNLTSYQSNRKEITITIYKIHVEEVT